uniref:Zinc finger protein ZFP69 n=1 Tax=Ceratitis capitata TaxID=7213 RepID=W8BUD5_CERCA
MDKESPELHFECLCRTCMHEVPEATIIASNSNQPAQQQWQYIFNTVDECDSMRITDLLVRIMPQLQLNFSKQLPQRICKLCLEYLLNAYRFQQMCLQSEQQLHDLVAKRRLDVKLMTTEIEVESKISILSEGVEPEGIEASYTPNVAISIEDPLQNSNINVVTNKTDIYLKTEQSDDEYDCCNYALKGAVERTGLADGPHIKIEIDTHTDVLEIEARTTSDEVSNHGDAGDSDWVINKTTLRSKKECSNEKKLTKVLLDNPLNEKTEEASPTYDCNLCKKSFNIRGYLLKHLRRHKRAEDKNSSPTPKRFECEICGNYYNKQESFEKHKQLHRSDAEKSAAAVKNFTCKFCENKYGTQPVLKRHMRQKHGEQYSGTADKRYTCEVCDKSYKQSTTLKDHMRTHTGEQPYLCSECGKAFNSLRFL